MQYYSITEAANALGMRPASVRRAILQGRLRAQRIGYYYAIDAAEIDRYRATPRHPGGRPRRQQSAPVG